MKLCAVANTFVCIVVSTLFLKSDVALGRDGNNVARVELVAESQTALSMRFVDARGSQLVIEFARRDSGSLWKAPASTHLGVIFGRGKPRYAGLATRRALGITPDQSLRTFDSTIRDATFDDLTVFKTYGGMAVGLWRGKSIAEIWYVGSAVARVRQVAQENGHTQACESALATCCDTHDHDGNPNTPPVPEGDPDICVSVIHNCPGARAQACHCLSTMSQRCPHPQPDAPATDPCTPEERSMSDCAMRAVVENCGEIEPPNPPEWYLELMELLRQILDRLQEQLEM